MKSYRVTVGNESYGPYDLEQAVGEVSNLSHRPGQTPLAITVWYNKSRAVVLHVRRPTRKLDAWTNPVVVGSKLVLQSIQAAM